MAQRHTARCYSNPTADPRMPMISTPLRLSASQARLLHLAAQRLLAKPRRRARAADVVAAVAHMRLLQIDTIHVVARSPYLVLFSRLGRYEPAWLDRALADGAIVECWAHEACFAPVADWPLHRRHQVERTHWAQKHAGRMHENHRVELDGLLARVRELGAVKASDFERRDGAASGGWWGWKAEKRWLEALFARGELMITRRENFHRVYDVPERVLAKPIAQAALAGADMQPDEAAMRRRFVIEAVEALGLTQARWIADYFRLGRRIKDAELDAYVDAGELDRVDVDGWDAPGYVAAANRALAAEAAAGRLRASHSALLSPFDPVVWDRERASAMFGFDYRIECYTPAPKRTYGYFVLPVLQRGRLVGRLDAKAHRAEGTFEVKALFLEPGVRESEALARDVAAAIRACAEWHGTSVVALGHCEPRGFLKVLRAALRG